MTRMNWPRQRQRETVRAAQQQARDESAYIRDLNNDLACRKREDSALWRDDQRLAFRFKCQCGHVGRVLTTGRRFKRGLRLRCMQCGKRYRF